MTSGKVCFELKVTELVNCPQAQSAGRTAEVNLNDVRIGFSAATATNQLGEDKHSYAVTMAGKKCTQKYFDVSTMDDCIAKNNSITRVCLLGVLVACSWLRLVSQNRKVVLDGRTDHRADLYSGVHVTLIFKP